MKETGILFTPENYDKTASGVKTQTRRVIKPQPILVNDRTWTWPCDGIKSKASWAKNLTGKTISLIHAEQCPYGTVGDRLYVKEGLERDECGARYRRDKQLVIQKTIGGRYLWQWQRDYLSPLHMPKWAARLWLELTDVRAERVREISYDDEGAEGVTLGPNCNDRHSGFIALWESINGKGSWDLNPWVWVLSYRRIQS